MRKMEVRRFASLRVNCDCVFIAILSSNMMSLLESSPSQIAAVGVPDYSGASLGASAHRLERLLDAWEDSGRVAGISIMYQYTKFPDAIRVEPRQLQVVDPPTPIYNSRRQYDCRRTMSIEALAYPEFAHTYPASSSLAPDGMVQSSSQYFSALVFVGCRSESDTFPYGFFQAWCLNRNVGRFESFGWQE
jgi:hypothetical protein